MSQAAAAKKGHGNQHESAGHKLISAEHYRIIGLGEAADQYSRNCTGQGRQQYEAFAGHTHIQGQGFAAGTLQVNQNNSCYTSQTAEEFAASQFFLTENQAGNHYAEEGVGSG